MVAHARRRRGTELTRRARPRRRDRSRPRAWYRRATSPGRVTLGRRRLRRRRRRRARLRRAATTTNRPAHEVPSCSRLDRRRARARPAARRHRSPAHVRRAPTSPRRGRRRGRRRRRPPRARRPRHLTGTGADRLALGPAVGRCVARRRLRPQRRPRRRRPAALYGTLSDVERRRAAPTTSPSTSLGDGVRAHLSDGTSVHRGPRLRGSGRTSATADRSTGSALGIY